MRIRIDVEAAGENLVEVSAGDHIVAFFILAEDEFPELICLGDLALTAVIGLQVEIDEHKLLVAPLNRQIAHEQAALEICDAQRPGEGAGESDTFSLVDAQVIRHGVQAAVHLPDGRHRHGHEGAGIVVGVSFAAHPLIEQRPLVNAVGARGVDVHLLEHDQIRIDIRDGGADPFQIAQRRFFAVRLGLRAAVHEEIGLPAESAVADVPAEHGKLAAGLERVHISGEGDGNLLHRLRAILCGRKPAQQRRDRDENHKNEDQNRFQNLFHVNSLPN